MKLDTRTIRLVEETYLTMKKLKARFQSAIKIKHITFSQYIDILNATAEQLLDGTKIYEVDGKFFNDQSEAWGKSVQMMIKGKPKRPTVYLCLGEDDSIELPEQGVQQ